MSTIDFDVVQILIDCGCSRHATKFAGLTSTKFLLYTRTDLLRCLPDASQEEIQKIEEEIGKQTTKEENHVQMDIFTRTGTPLTVNAGAIIIDDDNDDGKGQIKERSVPVDLTNYNNDDDDEGPDPITQPDQPPDDSSSEDSDDDKSKPIDLKPMSPKFGFQSLKDHRTTNVEILGHTGLHNCKTSHPSQALAKQWTDNLIKWGSKIRSLTMTTWTWQESACPWNLFRILTMHCLNIKKLSIDDNISLTGDEDQVPQFSANVTLSELKFLQICHDGDITYSKQLDQILQASPNLRSIYFSFGNLKAANSFLNILRDLRGDQLKHLKSLSITSYHEGGYLTEFQLVKLAKVEAVSLEELELGCSLWEDVDGVTVEEMLFRFSSTLKKLKIEGCFRRQSEEKPDILIKFPPMPHLTCIDIAGCYEYEEVFQDIPATSSANKRSRKGRLRNVTNEPTTTNPEIQSFSVTLEFCRLPNLRELTMGNLFDIKNLRFSNFPKMTTFHVGSRWDLCVTFPPNKHSSRRSSYPLVTHMQLPDCLDDPSFVKLIPRRFPNLKYCILELPTVKVLRTFFCSMAKSKLKELVLGTRFDFPSTLDTCLLDEPTKLVVSQSEMDKVRLLKEYGQWEEFVQFYNIELPEEDLSSLEAEGLAGLSSLKNLKYLSLEHRRRILRIPKGQFHWTSPLCEFTGEFIGFRQYPWSMACEQMRNRLKKKGLKDDSYLHYKVPFRRTKKPKLMETAYAVQPSKSLADVKVEEI